MPSFACPLPAQGERIGVGLRILPGCQNGTIGLALERCAAGRLRLLDHRHLPLLVSGFDRGFPESSDAPIPASIVVRTCFMISILDRIALLFAACSGVGKSRSGSFAHRSFGSPAIEYREFAKKAKNCNSPSE